MLKFSRDSEVDLDLYEERINNKNYILMDKELMTTILKYETSRMNTNMALAKRTMKGNADYIFAELGKESVLSYLIEVEHVPESKFVNRKSKTDDGSIDIKKVLMPIYKSGRATEFLEYYMRYSSLKQRCGRIEKLLKKLYDAGDVDRDGKTLYRLNYTVNQQENLRYNYKNEDLISIPKDYKNAFKVEDGYFLAWGDFAQSDWRIAYNLLIRDERNAAIMDSCDDAYEGMVRIIADYFNEPFDEEKFKEERELYKVNVLQTVYGQRHGLTPRDQEIITKIAKYIEDCPKYAEYLRRIDSRSDLGLSYPITGYFGYEQIVPYSAAYKKHAENKCLNSPIQTGTSQIVIITANKILDMFYELGYTEEDVSIYMVRHDEPVFKISEKAIKDIWILEQASTILVDNWTPLGLSFEYGYSYSVVDEELTQKIEESIERNRGKIEILTPDETAEEYWPLPKAFVCYVGTEVVGPQTVVCVYSSDEKAVDYILVNSPDPEEVKKVVVSSLLNAQHRIRDLGFSGVVVYNKLYSGTHSDQTMYYKFSDSSRGSQTMAELIAHYMGAKLAKREGIEFELNEYSIRPNLESIQKVGDLNVLQTNR